MSDWPQIISDRHKFFALREDKEVGSYTMGQLFKVKSPAQMPHNPLGPGDILARQFQTMPE
ncbi:hypothetical protein H5410_044942 [Solanum commersonii]|uniref:Uncharacterized protein n=1 Tax=Solanum commersonii TaxID=4109 RepID=A0A9J5XBC5_SOLCO|nr:hypothetical protein H5410_044942 [Solanum commersonii]